MSQRSETFQLQQVSSFGHTEVSSKHAKGRFGQRLCKEVRDVHSCWHIADAKQSLSNVPTSTKVLSCNVFGVAVGHWVVDCLCGAFVVIEQVRWLDSVLFTITSIISFFFRQLRSKVSHRINVREVVIRTCDLWACSWSARRDGESILYDEFTNPDKFV